MPIVITSSAGEQVFETRADVKLEPQIVDMISSDDEPAQQEPAVEEQTQEPAKEDEGEAQERDEFSYLSENEPAEEQQAEESDPVAKRLAELERRNAELEAKISGKAAEPAEKAPADEVIEDLKEPKLEEFDFHEDFIKAYMKYEVNEQKKALQAEQYKAEVAKEAAAIKAKYDERAAEAKKRYGSDKWQKAMSQEIPLSLVAQQEIIESEHGPDIAFYLAHNVEEAKRLFSLTPAKQIKELTKLELKVSNKLSSQKGLSEESRKVSKAPAPIKTISSSRTEGAVEKDPSKMTFQEYKAWRAKSVGKSK